MKTKFFFLTLAMAISTITISIAQEKTNLESGLNAFSFTEYLLMSICIAMLAVIWLLSRTIKSLSDQMR